MLRVKIGVVEDEMIIAATIISTLKKLNYSVAEPASNYAAALEMIENEQPHLLLLDIILGGQKDGIDVAEYVRANYNLPIIFLTANSDIKTLQRAKSVKPNAYLLKPFTKDDLFASIEIAISNYYENYNEGPKKENMFIRMGYDYVSLKIRDIVFIESNDNYVSVQLISGKSFVTRSTLSEMLKKLPENDFTKINRSIIVNHFYIKKIETDQVVVADTKFAISAKAKQELVEKVEPPRSPKGGS
jgi:DNA-binding LytR/AlgR family response regulator